MFTDDDYSNEPLDDLDGFVNQNVWGNNVFQDIQYKLGESFLLCSVTILNGLVFSHIDLLLLHT